MPRLYSGFPGRTPGAGLLLLRFAVGAALLAEAVPRLAKAGDSEFAAIAVCLLALPIGASLIVGFATRIAAVMATILIASITLFSMRTLAASVVQGLPFDLTVLAVAVAIACLGPGAFSLDAVFFGRRKVIIPRSA